MAYPELSRDTALCDTKCVADDKLLVAELLSPA